MLALKSHPTSPPHLPFLLNLNANLGFPQSPKTAEWLSVLDWVVTKILSSSYIL